MRCLLFGSCPLIPLRLFRCLLNGNPLLFPQSPSIRLCGGLLRCCPLLGSFPLLFLRLFRCLLIGSPLLLLQPPSLRLCGGLLRCCLLLGRFPLLFLCRDRCLILGSLLLFLQPPSLRLCGSLLLGSCYRCCGLLRCLLLVVFPLLSLGLVQTMMTEADKILNVNKKACD